MAEIDLVDPVFDETGWVRRGESRILVRVNGIDEVGVEFLFASNKSDLCRDEVANSGMGRDFPICGVLGE